MLVLRIYVVVLHGIFWTIRAVSMPSTSNSSGDCHLVCFGLIARSTIREWKVLIWSILSFCYKWELYTRRHCSTVRYSQIGILCLTSGSGAGITALTIVGTSSKRSQNVLSTHLSYVRRQRMLFTYVQNEDHMLLANLTATKFPITTSLSKAR